MCLKDKILLWLEIKINLIFTKEMYADEIYIFELEKE